MKQLFLLFIVLFTLSCNKPSTEIAGSSTEWTGSWEILPGADKPSKVTIDYVYVEPTWGQSFYYSLKDGGGWSLIAGTIVIIAVIVWGTMLKKNTIKTGLINLAVLFLGLAGALALIFSRPGTIKWNNNIKIEKVVYEKYKEDNNLKGLWDVLYTDKRIVGTSGE